MKTGRLRLSIYPLAMCSGFRILLLQYWPMLCSCASTVETGQKSNVGVTINLLKRFFRAFSVLQFSVDC